MLLRSPGSTPGFNGSSPSSNPGSGMVSHPARKASAIAADFCDHDRGEGHRSEQLTQKIEMADSSQGDQGPASAITTPMTMRKRRSGGAGEPATGDGQILLKILGAAFHHGNLQGEEDLQEAGQG